MAKLPQSAPEGVPLQLLLDAITDYAICMLDPCGAVVSWNAGAEQILGYCASEILGQNFSSFFTRQDRNCALPKQLLAQAKLAGRSETEGWRVRKGGSHFWAITAITRSRMTEARLRALPRSRATSPSAMKHARRWSKASGAFGSWSTEWSIMRFSCSTRAGS